MSTLTKGCVLTRAARGKISGPVRAALLGLAAFVTTGLSPGVPEESAARQAAVAPVPWTDQGLTDPALTGALDLHAHMAPDSPEPQVRGIDVLDLAKIAHARGMRGFVIKQQYDQTAQLAHLARKAVPGLEVFGGIVLSRTVGGISAESVRHMARVTGGWGRVVWMPTLNAEGNTVGGSNPPFVYVSRDGELLPEVKEMLDVIATVRTVDSDGQLVLATGHMPADEALLVLREAKSRGVTRMMVTHGATTWTPAQLREAIELGALIEVRAGFELINESGGESGGAAGPRQTATDAIRELGAEHFILVSDLGQRVNPIHPDGLALAARWLRSQGITDAQLDLMMKENPARLLGLPVE